MTRSLAELRQYLAGEWLFNNDFKDTSGNGNHGTPTDIEWKPTLRGMKPRFNGSSSKVDCGSAIDLTDEITVHIKLRPFKTSVDRACVFGYIQDDRLRIWYKPDGTVYMECTDVDGGISQTPTSAVLDSNTYNDIICSYSKQSGKNSIMMNGVNQEFSNIGKSLKSTNNLIEIGRETAADRYYNGVVGLAAIYETSLTIDEKTTLHNETKGEYGVMPAEHSFTHNPDDVIDASDAVGAWGTTKESTTKLVDLSGNNNIADIHGAMPAEGFIQSRRFTSVNENYLDCGNNSIFNLTDRGTIRVLVKISSHINEAIIIGKGPFGSSSVIPYAFINSANKIRFTAGNGTSVYNAISDILNTNQWYYITGIYDGSNIVVRQDGITKTPTARNGDFLINANHIQIGIKWADGYDSLNSLIGYAKICDCAESIEETKQFFNTLARLPFWSVNYTDYPDNVTEYTDRLPYSSSIISSGTFKVDDDVLNCVSAGTITYRASYEFDGSEYIKVEIDGVEYAGTGTITQGNTTVSVAQGSNKITIVMGTADTINKVRIQFREEV